jgi:outer membrane protein assembly factor BamD
MLKNRIYIIIIALCSLGSFISCTGYEKILKSDDVNLKFTKAFHFYNKGDYLKAATLFDQMAPIIRGTRRADSVYFYQAMTQYKLNDYIIAGHYFNNFVQMYGNSTMVEEAAYMSAYCFYMQSPRAELDQTSTSQALDAFRLYIIRYPNSPRIPDCEKIIVELNEKLMEKAYLSAQLYYNLDNYKAAVVSLTNCLSDFPETRYREEIMFKLLKAKYLLAVNSVRTKQTERFQDAIDEYFTYIAEYPESKNKKEADEIYSDASKFVKEPEDNDLSNK